ncbi:MAG: hypothetical protein QW212_00190 [Nitrososphaerales archaeon]
MKKVILEIDKEGKVELRGEGYERDECMRSEKLRKLLQSVEEIDSMRKLYQEQKKEVSYEELI